MNGSTVNSCCEAYVKLPVVTGSACSYWGSLLLTVDQAEQTAD